MRHKHLPGTFFFVFTSELFEKPQKKEKINFDHAFISVFLKKKKKQKQDDKSEKVIIIWSSVHFSLQVMLVCRTLPEAQNCSL